MPKPVRITLAVLLVGAAAVIGWQLWPTHDLVYQGKPLSYWLRGYNAGNGNWNESTRQKADEAVRHVGTNAIPLLLEMLASRDSALDIKLLPWSYTWRRWAGKIHFLKVRHVPYLHSYQAVEAVSAFAVLGPEARAAVPGLVSLLDKNLPRGNVTMIEAVLAGIGPAAKPAIPSLLREVQSSNAIVRGNALYALGCIRAEPKLVVPELAKALNDPDPYCRRHAAQALKAYGPEAKSAVPALVEAVGKPPAGQEASEVDPNDSVVAAQEALRQIDPEVAAKAGIR